MSSAETSSAPRELTRSLGLLDATMLVAGSMIGSGIFIVSADIARQLGSAGGLLTAWLVTGLLTLGAALSYGELAAMMPRAGGQYVYLREAYGPLWGFLYGWTLFLVIQTGTVAAVAVAFARFLGVLWPAVSEHTKWFEWGRFSLSPTTLVAIGVLVLLTWSNTRGLRTGKAVQNLFTLTKIGALAGLILLAFIGGWNSDVVAKNLEGFWTAQRATADAVGASGVAVMSISGWGLALAFSAAMVGALFSADAWNNVTFTAGEVIRPERNLPLSLFLGVTLVCGLYLLANLAYLATLPLAGSPAGGGVLERGIQFATSDRVATAAAEVVLGSRAAAVMAGLILVSTFGCINGMVLAGARVYYAMARDGLFFASAGALNRHGVPRNALVVQCLWACLLTFSGSYSDLLDYVIFAVLVFYVLTIAGVLVLRRKSPSAARPYRAIGYPLVPLLYVLVASGIVLGLLISDKTRGNTWPGLLIVLAGVPVYFLWRRLGRTLD